MRVQVYEQLMAMQRSRRDLLKGAAGAAALAASSSVLSSTPSYAEDSVVSQIMKIPGAGNGSPTDADWQKVGALCLGPTKANVKPGEFAGVEFSFMGLNNQNLHNFLFRGFLTPWEAYTGAKIKWIDLAQGDYNARLQQSIATGTVDFDIIEMGAPFEGDMGVKDLLSDMPDWVKTQIDFDDYVDYLKPPVGTWNGKTHRITIDSDCHTLNYRTDVFSDPDLAKQWKDWAVRATGDRRRPGSRCRRLQNSSRARSSKARMSSASSINPSPGAVSASIFSPAGPRLTRNIRARKTGCSTRTSSRRSTTLHSSAQSRTWSTRCRPSRRTRSTPTATPPRSSSSSPERVRSSNGGETLAHSRERAIPPRSATWSSFDILPGSDDVYNFRKGAWEKLASGPNQSPNMAYLGWGIYVMKSVDADPKRQKAAWSAAAHLGGKDLSMWTAAYPSGFQPYRKSHTNLDLWALAGYDKKYIGAYMDSQSTSYNHPNSAIEPRIPGIFQYYSIAEDELSKVYAGKETAQQGADNVAAAWEKLTDKLGRENPGQVLSDLDGSDLRGVSLSKRFRPRAYGRGGRELPSFYFETRNAKAGQTL